MLYAWPGSLPTCLSQPSLRLEAMRGRCTTACAPLLTCLSDCLAWPILGSSSWLPITACVCQQDWKSSLEPGKVSASLCDPPEASFSCAVWWLQAREAGEDVNLGGFHIPKGTRVWLNVRGMHLDEQHFPDSLVGRCSSCCFTCMMKTSGSVSGCRSHAGRRGILRCVPGLLMHPVTISCSIQQGTGSCCVFHYCHGLF